MNQPTQHHHLFAFVHSDRAALALSLIIGCAIASVATVFPGQAASVEPSPVQPISPPTAKPNPVAPVPVTKQLLGQWLTKEPLEGDMVMLVFAPDGNVFILSGMSASGNAIARQFQYRIDDKPRPMHIDVILTADATVKSVFEFTANGELRLEVLGTRPSKLRPAALTKNATLFQKLSDDTTPPPGVEVEKPSAQTK